MRTTGNKMGRIKQIMEKTQQSFIERMMTYQSYDELVQKQTIEGERI
jgi:mRNA-degrading endonuclease HigB of HigAB toxin-antitoxin module